MAFCFLSDFGGLYVFAGCASSTEIPCAVKWTAAITHVDRHSLKIQRNSWINTSRGRCSLEKDGETERERETEYKQSLRCIQCKWAPLNLLANGKWFSTADWLIGPRHGGMCCFVPSPWHGESQETHTSTPCTCTFNSTRRPVERRGEEGGE